GMRPAYWMELLLVALVYYGAGWAGLQLASASKQISLVWPDTGIALAILVLRGGGYGRPSRSLRWRRTWSAAPPCSRRRGSPSPTLWKPSSGPPRCCGWDFTPPCADCTTSLPCSCSRPV